MIAKDDERGLPEVTGRRSGQDGAPCDPASVTPATNGAMARNLLLCVLTERDDAGRVRGADRGHRGGGRLRPRARSRAAGPIPGRTSERAVVRAGGTSLA